MATIKVMARHLNVSVLQQRPNKRISVSSEKEVAGRQTTCPRTQYITSNNPRLTISPPPFSPAILLDTKGPEIRSGFFKEGTDKINLVKGNQIVLTADYSYKGDEQKLACSYDKIASSVNPGQQILVADGSLVLTVLSCDEDENTVLCRIENTTSIGERKNMNLPGVVSILFDTSIVSMRYV